MFTHALRRTCAYPNQAMRVAQFQRVSTLQFAAMRPFNAATKVPVKQSEESDDINDIPRYSLDEFYSSCHALELTDEQALEYMNFAANLAMVKFKDEKEMLDFKGAFVACLAFLGKLDEVDVKGVAPLGSVLEFYGGNQTMLRTEEDFAREGDDQTRHLNFKDEINKLNFHMDDADGEYVVVNKPKAFNPDCE